MKQSHDDAEAEPKKMTVAVPPKEAKLTPKRAAPPEPGYEAVTPFRKTSIEGHDYYVGPSEHVYEEPIWPTAPPKGGKAGKRGAGNPDGLKEVEEEEEEEEAGAAGGAPALVAQDAGGYNKPVHPGSKHISTEQIDRLCDAMDADSADVNDNNDDDDDAGYSRPLLQGSRQRLYDDADEDNDDDDHGYDEPYVETPMQLPSNDAVDKM